jgi:hypothetical protein
MSVYIDRVKSYHAATILRATETGIKPNPPKDGHGKPRVLASSMTFNATKVPKTAELPNRFVTGKRPCVSVREGKIFRTALVIAF